MIRRREGRHVLVLLSDGYDEHSVVDARRRDRARCRRPGRPPTSSASAASPASRSRARRCSRASPRPPAGAPSSRTARASCRSSTIASPSDVATRYLLTYTPTNQRVDGSFRAIRLVTADATLVVRTKPGYYAPKPPPVRPTLELTAVDESRRVLDVTREDLVVVEDGVAQTVEAFSEATSPVSIVLALDESGSMRRSAEGVKAAARSFVEALRKEDRLAVLRFSDKAEIAHDLTQFRSDAMKAIDEYTSHGGTALWDAVHESNGRLRTAEGRRVVVVMTDGRDENATANGPGSATKYDDLLEELRATGALVYAIGLGTNVDRERLQIAGRPHRRRGLLPRDGRGAVGRVRAHRREPAPAVRHRLHLDQQPPRRRLAGGVGDQPAGRRPHRQPRRLLRAAALSARLHGASAARRGARPAPNRRRRRSGCPGTSPAACGVPTASPASRNSIWLATPWTRRVRSSTTVPSATNATGPCTGRPSPATSAISTTPSPERRDAGRQPQGDARRATAAVGWRRRRRRRLVGRLRRHQIAQRLHRIDRLARVLEVGNHALRAGRRQRVGIRRARSAGGWGRSRGRAAARAG